MKSIWLLIACACCAEADEPFELRVDQDEAAIVFSRKLGYYYTLAGIATESGERSPLAIDVGVENGELGRFEIGPVGEEALFYEVRRVPDETFHDLDGDEIGDLFEIAYPEKFDPLNGDDGWPLDEGSYFIGDRDAFEFLAQRSDFPGAFQAREVKILIEKVDTDEPQLYFINTANIQYHYNFASQSLGLGISAQTFSAQTYFNSNRRFIAGSLVAHDYFETNLGEEGIYTLEFWPTDPIGFEHVSLAYDLVVEAMPFAKEKIFYHAPGETQIALYEEEKSQYEASNIQVMPTEELFENISYVPMNMGTSYGRLILAENASQFSVRDIVIFDTIPNTISHIAGIITELPQTPLSHINLKAKQNDTPNAYIRDISDESIQSLLGQNVRFEVTPDGYSLEPATQAEVDAYLESVRPEEEQTPVRDLSETEIRSLSNLGFEDSSAVGAKAANVAELGRFLPQGVVPEGFAVPFYFYDEFMKLNGFYEDAEEMMDTTGFGTDPDKRDDALDDFRDRIRDEGVLPKWMLDALQAMHDAYPASQSLRCRSSTNNEDLPGFNGAGLYNSYTHHPDEGHISKSMKQVWASLWTYRAFEEREFYRIDHFTTAMGVLVHPNFSNEQVNGVAVTKNIFDVNWRGYYVNAQVGEDLVTNPEAESIPEEFLVADLLGEERYEIQYIRSSNQVENGERVLSKEQVFELADHMFYIQSHFRALYQPIDDAFAMEIEFKITEDGDLSIKQARPWVE
ncbi:PEP/pyruvate-binding domain-containing protein [Puniceicoccaceae bacterium K14]|nr:PEP/pyruvate-binding domain-containing protein [Puniceicoccaceae bacterium K14]